MNSSSLRFYLVVMCFLLLSILVINRVIRGKGTLVLS